MSERTTIDDGGPAFPIHLLEGETLNAVASRGIDGMSLRDFFAAASLAGLNASPITADWCSERLATQAYDDADAMLAQRIVP